MKLIVRAIPLFFTIAILSCGGKDLSIEERYPMPWKEPLGDEFVSIGRTLVKNDASGCGEYYVRASSQDKGEYLVGCTADGDNWSYYIVWTEIQKLEGPFSDTTIQKPR